MTALAASGHLVGVIAVSIALTACAGTTPADQSTTSPTTTTSTTTTTTDQSTTTSTEASTQSIAPHSTIPSLSAGEFLVAHSQGELEIYAYPTSLDPIRSLPATTILGTPQVYLVEETIGNAWVRIALPGRPHGSSAWIPADAVTFEVVNQMIEVSISGRTLRFTEGEQEAFTTPAAVGSPTNPTPSGFFYVTDIVAVSDPASPWGPYALGLSARSETITEFNGGDGIIGIHGTSRPATIGQAVSLGCVRIDNELITQLAATVKLGAPVLIEG